MKLLELCVFCVLMLSGITGSDTKAVPSSAIQFVSDAIHCHELVVFTKTGCPNCHLTKEMFHSLNYTFVEVQVDSRADAVDIQRALYQLTGAQTWPQVFVWGRFVGGVAEVWKWYRNGHLFSNKVDEKESTDEERDDRQVAFGKLVKTSEKAIKWIENKTTKSWGKYLNIKSYFYATEATKQMDADTNNEKKKTNFFSWLKNALRDKFQFNSRESAEEESEDSLQDSDEKLVIAHRNENNRFSWGPAGRSRSQEDSTSSSTDRITAPERLMQVAKDHVKIFFSYLYNGTKSITERSKMIIKNSLSKVFSRKGELDQQYTPESIKEQLDELINGNAKFTLTEETFPCDDTFKPVCAVDLQKHFTIFHNKCKMALYNYQHDTNFSIFENNLCISLFAQYPELYVKFRENH